MLIKKYPVRDADHLVASVNIGDGHAGGAAILIDGQTVATGPKIKDKPLGTGKSLRGSELMCTVEVRQVNRTSEWATATLRISGGPAELRLPEAPERFADGEDSATYTFLVQFV